MFKALHKPSGDEIILLDPRWQPQLSALRKWDAQDALVCQGCLQPVRVRAGRLKRWHFAHKHLRNCPYETESPGLLHTRAVLYEWLVSRLGVAHLTLEKKTALPRPVDCWVDSQAGSIGYWIIDTRMPPEERTALAEGLAGSCSHPVWVFTAAMFHADSGNLDRLYLTTTEREFMRSTVYDPPVQYPFASPGGSLHYLDAEQNRLLTFRGLQVHHPPQLYAGHSLETPLSQVGVDAETGEFIHPGEAAQLERYQIASAERARQQAETAQRITQKMAELFGKVSEQPDVPSATSQATALPPEPSGEAYLPVCVFCGKKTDDYWYLNRADHTCKCRDCYRQGKY
jgi:hypothetical protein